MKGNGVCSFGKMSPPICLMIFPIIVLTACSSSDISGGIPIVTPLDGQWSTDAGEAIQFGGFTREELHFAEILSVDVTIQNPQFICEGAIADSEFLDLTGTLQAGELELFVPEVSSEMPCMTGVFTDLRTLRIDPVGELSERLFLNTRVDVDMAFGLWVSSDAGDLLRLKFVSPQSVENDSVGVSESNGCVLDADGDDVNFTGLMNGFDTVHGVNPTIPELISSEPGNPVLFTQLVFVDNDTIRLSDADGHRRVLVRMPDIDESDCP